MARIGAEAPEALITEVEVLTKAGKLAEAINALEAIVAEYPECLKTLSALGYCYHWQGRDVDAAHTLERVALEKASYEMVANSFYFRNKVALNILDGVPANGDGPIKTRVFDQDDRAAQTTTRSPI
jgi:hypothetical protein